MKHYSHAVIVGGGVGLHTIIKCEACNIFWLLNRIDWNVQFLFFVCISIHCTCQICMSGWMNITMYFAKSFPCNLLMFRYMVSTDASISKKCWTCLKGTYYCLYVSHSSSLCCIRIYLWCKTKWIQRVVKCVLLCNI